MLISFSIILVLSLSGLSLSFLFTKRETILWRLAAGNIIGSALFGLVCFIAANLLGFSVLTIFLSLAISLLPFLLLRNKRTKARLKDEWQRAKDKTQGTSIKRFRRLAYYLFFFILFVAFFDRAMIVAADGIFTGASQNLGDLPFHLGAILGFSDGNNFPPQNPSFANAKFTYPFMADFLTACLVKLGASVKSAMLVQNVGWAFSLLVLLERFVSKVTKSRFAGKVAPFILFFSGGLGFVWFFKDYWYGTQSIFDIIWNLPRDYTIGDKFRWGNSMIVLFITQRSLLLGMPLAIIVLGCLWRIFASGYFEESNKNDQKKTSGLSVSLLVPAFAVGIIAGTLPLIHAHSLIVLFVVSALLFFFSIRQWGEWFAFAIGVLIIAVPELLWILSGSATDSSKFIAWHFGWDVREDNIFWFWFKNTGILIPLLISAFLLFSFSIRNRGAEGENEAQEADSDENGILPTARIIPISIFFLPFFFIFVGGNILKLAPWEWDNIKVLVYWFVGSIPIVGLALAWIWSKGNRLRAVAIALTVVLTFSGALDVWRVASAQMRHQVFDSDAVKIAEVLKKRTRPHDLFLHAPTYNSPIVLTGRRSLMRYIGHLSSHGIDYKEREDDLKRIYSGIGTSGVFLRKYDIDYVLISPKERESFEVNEKFFEKYPVIAEEGLYKVYQVK